MITNGYLVEYSKVFDDSPKDFSFYLEGMGIDRIVDLCSHFLSLDLNDPIINDYTKLLDFLFSDNNPLKHDVLTKIHTVLSKPKTTLQIINHYCIYQLFEYSIKELPPKTSISLVDTEIQIFKSILILNELYNQRGLKIQKELSGLDTSVRLPSIYLSHHLCSFDICSFNLLEVVITQIVKSYYLFSFLQHYDENTKTLLVHFCKDQNFIQLKHVIQIYLTIFLQLLSKEQLKPLTLNIPTDCSINEIHSFLNNYIFNDSTPFNDVDFIEFRKKPIFKIDERKYRVISPLFITEKLYSGLFFELNRINENLKQNRKFYYKDFGGFYCSNFTEEFLFYNIIERIFPKKFTKFSGKSLKERGIDGEPDYYVRNKNKVFLFESKDVHINKEVKQSSDFRKIEQCLREKFYYYYDKSGVKRHVGISQLLENIKRILTNNFSIEIVNSHVKIYPILITYHNVFNTPGLNFIINKWFQDELKKIDQDGINVENVQNLVIIDFNILILYMNWFKIRRIRLEQLLDDYIIFTSSQKSEFNSITSFSMFVEDHTTIKKIKVSIDILKELVPNLFQDDDEFILI